MKQALVTVSFSIDKTIRDDLDKLSSETGRSKSDIFREMYSYYRFSQALRNIQEYGSRIAERVGLESEEEVYEYLDSLK